MIDDKKIEEAANLHRFELIASMHGSTLDTPMQCFEELIDAETDLIENSFITGAKWAINEFLKDLWHPVSEKPRRNTIYLAQIGNCAFDTFFDNKDWEKFSKGNSITRWLYVGDLLPKGGE